MQYISHSHQDTTEIGKKIAAELSGGDVILLFGDLGAGKTTLTKGIALYLGIKEDILSPTFTLMNVIKIEDRRSKITSLVHIDTYRLKNEEQLVEIGVEDYIGQPDTITIIEWPEKLEKILINKKIITVKIEHQENNTRTIEIK